MSIQRIEDFNTVLTKTHGKDDPVNYWARRAVISEAMMNIAYLKRRIIQMRTESPRPVNDIKRAIGFIRELQPIADSLIEPV